MAVNQATPIVTGNGGGTSYPFHFRAISVSDVKVFVNGVEVKTGFTVALANDKGGTVTFTTATPAGKDNVMIRRDTPFKRDTDYQTNGDLLADTLDDDFDRLWLCLQEEKAASDVTLSKPVGAGAWDAKGIQIENLQDGSAPQDAATYGQLTIVQGNATASANAAEASRKAAEAAEGASFQNKTDAAQSAAQAATSAQASEASNQASGTSATDAAASAELARKWAINPEGQEVIAGGGEFSSYHWAQKSESSEMDAKQQAQAAALSVTNAEAQAQLAAQHAAAAAAANPASQLLKSANLSDLADRAAAWLNVRPLGASPLSADGVAPGDAVTVRQLSKATGATGATMNGVLNSYIGCVEWFNGSRTKLPAGYIAADGDEYERTAQPELWEAVNNGFLLSTTDALWLDSGDASNVSKNRGRYSTGSTASKFRVPDLNGVQPGSAAALFLRGSGDGTPGGMAIYGAVGQTFPNGAPNINGSFKLRQARDTQGTLWGNIVDQTPPFTHTTPAISSYAPVALHATAATAIEQLTFDASKNSIVYGRSNEVRPNSAVGIWIIRASAFSVKADSAFSVIDADATAPAAGSTVDGGEITSDYMAAGKLIARASLKVNKTFGGAAVASVTVTDNETDPAHPVIKTLYLPARDGTLTTREQIGWGGANAAEMRLADGTATTDANALRINGLYSAPGDSAVNFPTTTNGKYGPILHMARYDTGTMAQINISDAGGLCVRGSSDGGKTWNQWLQMGAVNAGNTWLSTQAYSGPEAIRLVGGDARFISCRVSNSSASQYRWRFGNTASDNNLAVINDAVKSSIYLLTSGGIQLNAVASAGSSTVRRLAIDPDGSLSHPLGGDIPKPGSDIRLKDNVVPAAPGALARIEQVAAKEFNWKDGGQRERGYIGQELQAIDPLYVRESKDGYLCPNQNAIIADLISAVQELKAEVEALKANK